MIGGTATTTSSLTGFSSFAFELVELVLADVGAARQDAMHRPMAQHPLSRAKMRGRFREAVMFLTPIGPNRGRRYSPLPCVAYAAVFSGRARSIRSRSLGLCLP